MERATLFEDQAHRLQGVPENLDLTILGKSNLAQLVTLAQHHVQTLWQTGTGADELRPLREEIARLQERHDAAKSDKPTLPRLRSENFRKGDRVMLYLGDTPGALPTWAEATIVEKTKSHRSDWKNTPSKGYYWRHVAEGKTTLFPDSSTVAFATSEPRVVPLDEWHWLKAALTTDPEYVSLYAANARRDWQPLWCLEREVIADVTTMDFLRWLQTV